MAVKETSTAAPHNRRQVAQARVADQTKATPRTATSVVDTVAAVAVASTAAVVEAMVDTIKVASAADVEVTTCPCQTMHKAVPQVVAKASIRIWAVRVAAAEAWVDKAVAVAWEEPCTTRVVTTSKALVEAEVAAVVDTRAARVAIRPRVAVPAVLAASRTIRL